ncbi:hypothetical protein F4778DRAFT_45480 [Xylariomycetidae sp. FL2044]|nr:hypothetical protein F4778DRAFT_45480 [Xylariomycetidae sp. FL2044]
MHLPAFMLLPLGGTAAIPATHPSTTETSSPSPSPSHAKRYDSVPFSPTGGNINKCGSVSHRRINNDAESNVAEWLNCVDITETKGTYWLDTPTTDSNSSNGDNNWSVLGQSRYGGCAILVRSGASTAVSSKDVDDLLRKIKMEDDIRLADIEEKGSLYECGGNVTVDFWLRGAV